MRVLVVTSLYPPHSFGGYEASCRDVVQRWRADGDEVTVLTTTTRVRGAADDPAESGVRRELDFWWVDHALREPGWGERLRVDRANRAVLRRALAEVRPDMVSMWSMGALSLSLLNEVTRGGLPLVLVVCDDWLVYGERADPWRRGLARRPARRALASRLAPTAWPARESAAVAWVSASVQSAAHAQAPWVPARETVVPSGIDPVDFPALRSARDRPWRGRLLCVGRLDPRKGLDVAVRAAATLPGTTLHLVGAGDASHASALTALAAELGVSDRVQLVGPVPRGQLAPVYAEHDVLLFPVTWDEPFGLVPLEAMACGTPVVATGTGGSAEHLREGENCLLVPPGDPAALAAAVDRLRDDARLRRRVVAGGLVTAREYGVDRYANRLREVHVAELER